MPRHRRRILPALLSLARLLCNATATAIADVLVRLGLKTSRPSVQRKLLHPPPRRPHRLVNPVRKPTRGIRPRHAHNVWFANFTQLSWLFGFFTLHVGAVIDGFSRKILAVGICEGEPTAAWTIRLLCSAISWHGAPRHFITDQGTQFTSKRMTQYLKRNCIRWRQGAVGSSQSISVVKRFRRTLKCEWATVWLCWAAKPILELRLREWVAWYHEHRVHHGIGGRTTDEVERGHRRRKPFDGKPEDRWLLVREEFCGQKRMPIHRLRKSA